MEAIAEVSMAHSGMSAETETAGLQLNYVPKDGGNQFSATARSTFTNSDFQSSTISTELAGRGVTSAPSIRKIWDYGASLGGPIVRDRLWFFTAHRWWGAQNNAPGAFANASQGQVDPVTNVPIFVADMNKTGFSDNYNQDNSARFTWQASPVDKLTYYGNKGDQCVCNLGVSSAFASEATVDNGTFNNHLSQITYTRAHSNAILIEGGFSYLKNPFTFPHSEEVSLTDIPIFSLTSQPAFYNASDGFFGALPYNDTQSPSPADQLNARAALSYVTGSHNFKFGMNWSHGYVEQNGELNEIPGYGPVSVWTLFGSPLLLNHFLTPKFNRVDFQNVGLYAQDQWTLDRFTVNLGVRADFFKGWSPVQVSPATAFSSELSFPRVEDIPNWKDVSPRLGVAWDVTGDGKTAVKASAGRYMGGAGAGIVQANNPANRVVRSATRTWIDFDGDFFPDAIELLTPFSNPAFGTPQFTTFYDPSVIDGGRQGTWQFSVGVDREVLDNVSVSVTYFRTQHFNQTVRDDQSRVLGDYDPFSVTVPSDARIPGGGGNQISGFFNPSFAAQATPQRVTVTNDKFFGVDHTEVYDGVDFEMSARFAKWCDAPGRVQPRAHGERRLLRGGLAAESVQLPCGDTDQGEPAGQVQRLLPVAVRRELERRAPEPSGGPHFAEHPVYQCRHFSVAGAEPVDLRSSHRGVHQHRHPANPRAEHVLRTTAHAAGLPCVEGFPWELRKGSNHVRPLQRAQRQLDSRPKQLLQPRRGGWLWHADGYLERALGQARRPIQLELDRSAHVTRQPTPVTRGRIFFCVTA